jgi:AraC family transcriptional regulator
MTVQLPRGAYFGRKLLSREMAGLILTEKTHPVGERTPVHAHQQPYLCLVLEGSWKEQFEGGNRTCTPRTVIYHPSGDAHSDDFSRQSGRVFAIELDENWSARLNRLSPLLDRSHEIAGGTVAATAVRIYDESRRADKFSELVIEGLMLELIGLLSRSTLNRTVDAAPRWLRLVEEILQRDFRDPPDLPDLAARAGVHPVHLSRAFRARHGCSINEYIRRNRVEYACHVLATSDCSLVALAYDAGFSDQSHFTNTFRRVTGTTPARFRATSPTN